MPSTRTSGSTNQRNAHRRKRLRNHADGSEENALPGLRSNQQRGLFQYEDPRPKPEQAMRKYAYATLCGTLLFSGKAAFAIETSLLDRLAQERIIGDDRRPQAYPVPSQPGARAASPAQAPSANAELVGQLRRANEQLQELEQKLARRNRATRCSPSSWRSGWGARRNPAPWPPSRNRIRPASANWASGLKTRRKDALAAELASARTATAGNAQDSALSAALGAPAPRSPA